MCTLECCGVDLASVCFDQMGIPEFTFDDNDGSKYHLEMIHTISGW